MAKRTRRWMARTAGVATLLCWGSALPAPAAPTPAQILSFTPRQAGVDCTTPTAEQQKDCKVELVKTGKGSGWLLSDKSGTLRRFADTNGDNKIDTWSFYKAGIEVYREVDSNANGKPDQYRWLNGGGSKWGVDQDEDGHIDGWRAISAEEASQEALLAVSTRDYSRLQALPLTEAEIKALDLSAAEAQRVRASLREAQGKFTELLSKLKGIEKASWIHLETAAPQCRPAEDGSTRLDLVHHLRGTIVYEASGKTDSLQTGEIIQVGAAWKLVGAPSQGAVPEQAAPAGAVVSADPKMQKLIEELTEMDKSPPASGTGGPNAEIVKYNLKRAGVLEKILAEVPAKERETWVRQVADSLGIAAQNSAAGETAAAERLQRLEQQVVGATPNTPLAGYVVYRRMQADYSARLFKPGVDSTKVQQEWKEKLTKFVTTYPNVDDTPDALMQLGVVSEFLGKDADAKNWYGRLVRDFADKPQTVKARGAVRRLESEGKEFGLTGPLLEGGSFEMSQARGKVVAVYYWASWNDQSSGDFAKLKQVLDSYKAKGFELVCVNLDGTAEEARAAIKRTSAVGIHLHQPGGAESKLATDYGIMGPQVFLVGKDGKVVSRNVPVTGLEDEVKKLLK